MPVLWPDSGERCVFPQDELVIALVKERHAEIQRAFNRYYEARIGGSAWPSGPGRLVRLVQGLRRWTPGTGRIPAQRSPHVDAEDG
jgi:hypothetical protein